MVLSNKDQQLNDRPSGQPVVILWELTILTHLPRNVSEQPVAATARSLER